MDFDDHAHLAELVDAGDLKSSGLKSPSGFESRGEHHLGVRVSPSRDGKLFIVLPLMPLMWPAKAAEALRLPVYLTIS